MANTNGKIPMATSCEGYITKRGYFLNSWQTRYLVFDGANLLAQYYNDRHSAAAPLAVPKGKLYLSGVEKKELVLHHLMSASAPSYGLKLMGHLPGKGYVELDIFLDTLADRDQWLHVLQNALTVSKRFTRQGESDNTKNKELFGFSATLPKEQQLSKLKMTKGEMLRQAVKELEDAKLVSAAAVTELSAQGEQLTHAEEDLEHIHHDLDYGEKLINQIKSPILHMFSGHKHNATSQHATTHNSYHSSTELSTTEGIETSSHPTQAIKPVDDLERLMLALNDLEKDAELVNTEVVKSNEQISHIASSLSNANVRIEKQTKAANVVVHKRNLF